jgi:hypothetical protein
VTIPTANGLLSGVNLVQLALDSQGRPRLLVSAGGFSVSPGVSYSSAVLYATCDSGCATASGWKLTPVVTSSLGDRISSGAYRPFALDPQGRPRFVYTDVVTGHRGTFYSYCDSGCTQASNWHEVMLSDNYLTYEHYLAISPSGQTKIVYRNAANSPDKLDYGECPGDCAAGGAFNSVDLFDLGYEHGFSMRLDASGRPRLAVYAGCSLPTGAQLEADKLHYAWCDSADCVTAGWTFYGIGLDQDFGKEPDLALDGQGRPQIAYRIDSIATSTYALGYALCDASCQANGATWRSLIRETDDQLNALQPVPPKSGCSISLWDFWDNVHPSLALDGAGNPRIGYDARHIQGGTCQAHTDIVLARFTLFDRP